MAGTAVRAGPEEDVNRDSPVNRGGVVCLPSVSLLLGRKSL